MFSLGKGYWNPNAVGCCGISPAVLRLVFPWLVLHSEGNDWKKKEPNDDRGGS